MPQYPRCSFLLTLEGLTGIIASLPVCLMGLCRT